MKFQFEKLGNINKAELELGDLTIICGKNNTGKTYVSYAIYGFLATWNNFNFDLFQEEKIDDLLKNGILKIDLEPFKNNISAPIKKLSQDYTRFVIPKIFSANEGFFSETSFEVIINDNPNNKSNELQFSAKAKTKEKEVLKAFNEKGSSILEITLLMEDEELTPPTRIIKEFINGALGRVLLEHYFFPPFIITAERSGISLFYRELDISKNVLVEQLQRQSKKFELVDFLKMINDTVSRYAHPIQNSIDFVRDIPDHSKKISPLFKEHPEFAKNLKNLLGGELKVINDQIFFVFKQARKNQIIPLYLSSSTVKSLLELNVYIKYIAKKGDILFIDEPELNLHPANQRKMARLFVRLIKAGIKVFITTHSDYIIKEFNALITLNNQFEGRKEIMEKYKYTEEDVLDKNQVVKVYIAEKNTLVAASIDNSGIEVPSFDKDINKMNDMYDDMLFAMDK